MISASITSTIDSKNPNLLVGFIESVDNKKWLHLTLNKVQSLNALDELMLIEIQRLFDIAEAESEIAGVFIDSATPRAFCAGGDVKDLLLQIQNKGPAYIDQFFTTEYRLDRAFYFFKKPYVAFLEGICFGGGMGISQPADLRIATPTVRLSMPEIHIGLFADVASHFFLKHLPVSLRRFIAMSGAQLDAEKSYSFALVDLLVRPDEKSRIIEFLRQHAPEKTCIKEAFAKYMGIKLPQFTKEDHIDLLSELEFLSENSDEADPDFSHLKVEQLNQVVFLDSWLKANSNNLALSCPYSQLMGYLLFKDWDLEKTRTEKIVNAFRREFAAAKFMAGRIDFKEGVSQKLILKSKDPCHWDPPTLNKKDTAILQSILAP